VLKKCLVIPIQLNPHAEVRVLFAIPAELWQGACELNRISSSAMCNILFVSKSFFLLALKLRARFMFIFSSGLAAVTLFDLAGLFFRFRSISMDHAAHLGGSLFGALYAAYGLPLWRRRDELFGASLTHNKADGTHIPIIKKSDREKK
jgi:membrane associated rhomboid family serine protease